MTYSMKAIPDDCHGTYLSSIRLVLSLSFCCQQEMRISPLPSAKTERSGGERGRPNGGRAFTSQSGRLKTLLFWRPPLLR